MIRGISTLNTVERGCRSIPRRSSSTRAIAFFLNPKHVTAWYDFEHVRQVTASKLDRVDRAQDMQMSGEGAEFTTLIAVSGAALYTAVS